jgi:hypothetical protein
MVLAPPLQRVAHAFERFYRQWPGHASRHAQLLWCPTAGTATLAFLPRLARLEGAASPTSPPPRRSPPPRCEVQVVVSTPQACLLLLFTARRTTVTLGEMAAALQLPPPQVWDELRGLLAPDQQLLVPVAPEPPGAAAGGEAGGAALWGLSWSAARADGRLFDTAFQLHEAFLNAPRQSLQRGSSGAGSAGASVVVVHGVRDDAQVDFLSDAAAAAALFGWRAQVKRASEGLHKGLRARVFAKACDVAFPFAFCSACLLPRLLDSSLRPPWCASSNGFQRRQALPRPGAVVSKRTLRWARTWSQLPAGPVPVQCTLL